jgi:hypothetical protein
MKEEVHAINQLRINNYLVTISSEILNSQFSMVKLIKSPIYFLQTSIIGQGGKSTRLKRRNHNEMEDLNLITQKKYWNKQNWILYS